MGVLIGKEMRLIVQGITGKQGAKISQEMIDYGTTVIAGVTPGKGGQLVNSVPVYNCVREALLSHPEANASLITVPREGAKDAANEAITSGPIKLVNILTEGIPRRDAAEIVQCAKDHGVRVVGPASIGIINPVERVKIGAIGGNDPGVFYPGQIAIFSKSGGMCLSIATEIFNTIGYGTSLVVGIGGDRILGTSFRDLLELVREDENTTLVILNGEIGGAYEEEAAAYILESRYPKPVVARLTGIGAEKIFPLGSRMGHAGAIIGEGSIGSYTGKVEAFEKANVPVAKTSEELIHLAEAAIPTRGVDLEDAVPKELEVVSISKTKLENLKSQIRAVQIRTALTRIADGVPYFRGYPLTDLIRNASLAEVGFMAFNRKDPSHEDAFQFKQDFLYCAENFSPSEESLNTATLLYNRGEPIQVALSASLTAMQEPDANLLPERIAKRYSSDRAQALMIAPQLINIVAYLFNNSVNWNLDEPIQTTAFSAVAGRIPTVEEREVFRAIFVACIDHTPATPSSLAAITCYSGGNSLKTAVAAGIAAMGDTHAGAGEGAARIFRRFLDEFHTAKEKSGFLKIHGTTITNLKDLAHYLVDVITGACGGEKRRIPGYGHRYYSFYGSDPRAEALLEQAKDLGVSGEYCELAKEIQIILQEKKSPGLCINVDGVIGALICDMSLRPEAGKPVFIMPRAIGILAQLLEQREGAFFRLSNDSIIYTGPEHTEERRFE